jgi:copper chaperone
MEGLADMNTTELVYSVPDVSCGHCEVAITGELSRLPGVDSVVVDLDAKRVSVRGTGLSEADVVAAIDEAGYEVAA